MHPAVGSAGGIADFTGTTVFVPPAALFDYLSDVGNLPRYFSRMTSAQPGQGEEVRTTAKMPDGTEAQGHKATRGSASTRARSASHGGLRPQCVLRAPAGPAGRAGQRGGGAPAQHPVPEGDSQVQDGVSETLANIKKQAESS